MDPKEQFNVEVVISKSASDHMCNFLINNYDKAINLKNKFRLIEKKDWDSLTVLSELTVQIGHIFNVFIKDDEVSEKCRYFDNLGDELSDVLLQLTYLVHLEENYITDEDIQKFRTFDYSNVVSLPILLGQLHEALLEKYEYRFDKPREGFKTRDEFIKDRILRIYLIVFNFAEQYKINLNDEFEKMNQDASAFILRKIQDGNA